MRSPRKSLQLPCDATEIEDSAGKNTIGLGDPKELERLHKKQPSYEDTHELVAIENRATSEWMMFHGEDVVGCVLRNTDGKEFYLGLGEIEAVDRESGN